ncbi:MAG TPA: ethanolamine utilization microcompartment protein EutL [Candidatus Anaerobutyricum faecale]|nr:ethanolamine utilization microcompartment protein EutL [Candidatus Anaerobutyricum faecale]
MKRRVQSQVTMQKVVPNVTDAYRALWDIPEDHGSVGFIACDNEDVMWLALDDATKKAKIEIVHAETVYGGVDYSWSRYGGEINAVLSGENVSDVQSGIRYVKDYIENRSACYMLDEEGTLGYYADWIPRAGRFYQKKLGIPEGMSLAYLVSTPVESTYALDKALKASDTKVSELFRPPTRVNTGGGVLTGTESACRAAVQAFAEAVEYCAFHPMEVER